MLDSKLGNEKGLEQIVMTVILVKCKIRNKIW